MFKAHPEYIAARETPDLTRAPRYQRGRWVEKPFFVRCFVLLGHRPRVLPGGLCLQSRRQSEDARCERFSGSKDIWIQTGDTRPRKTESSPGFFPAAPDDLPITSRAAESLYWIGRYNERAENTARMLLVLEECSGEGTRRAAGSVTRALWLAVAEATGQKSRLKQQPTKKDAAGFIGNLLHDAGDPASVLCCLRAARDNTQVTREFVTPEVWAALLQALRPLEKSFSPNRVSRDTLRETCRSTVRRLAELRGTASRTMPRDESWHFYRMGEMMERAQATFEVTTGMLRAILDMNLEEDADHFLVALLRMLGSLDAYRRTYRSRPRTDHVATLLFQNPENPGSIFYCLERLKESLDALQMGLGTHELSEIRRAVNRSRKYLRDLRCADLFPGTTEIAGSPSSEKKESTGAEKAYERLDRDIGEIHRTLEDTCFHHPHSPEPHSSSNGQ